MSTLNRAFGPLAKFFLISMQELYLGSTLMMDPMSLLDYPQVECGTGEVLIAVEGDMDTILKDGEAKT